MNSKPTRYIAFLRAINVGGHVVKMERLRELFSELGLLNVRTYIQSGNVFFESNADRSELTHSLETHLTHALGYEMTVFLRTIPELEQALNLRAFAGVTLTEDIRLYVIFINAPLPTTATLPLRAPKGDIELLAATAGEVFAVLHLVNGQHGSAISFIEKSFGVRATGRFAATTEKILQATKE